MPRERIMPENGERDFSGTGSVVADPVGGGIETVAGDIYENPSVRADRRVQNPPDTLERPGRGRVSQQNNPFDQRVREYEAVINDPSTPPEDRETIINERNELEEGRQAWNTLHRLANQDVALGGPPTLSPEEEQKVKSKEQDQWDKGMLYLTPRTETGGMVEVSIPREPGKMLGYMRNILNQIEQTYEAQGKPEIRVDLQKLYLAMPVLKEWGEEKPAWMSEEDHKQWKGVINKAGKIMSEEFEFRFAFHQSWVKFANASGIDDAVGGMSGMYTDQLNYLLVKGRKNNLLVSAAFEWMEKNSEEFLLGTPEHQEQMRKKLLHDLEHNWKPKNKISEDIVDPETKKVTPGVTMDLRFTDDDYLSAQLVGEHMFVLTARLAQKNFLVDKERRYKLDPNDPVDAQTIKSGAVALAYSPGSGGQGQINNSKAMEWLHTQTNNYKDTYGGFPVEDLLKGVDFNDKDFLSILPSQVGDYYKDRLFEIYKAKAEDAEAIGVSREKASKDSIVMVEAVFGIDALPNGKFPKLPDLSKVTFSREELIDHAENETDPVLKAEYQARLKKLTEIFDDIQKEMGPVSDEDKPELLVKQWEEGEFIDFNWQTIWRPGRWANYNVGLPQKVADSIQKPNGFMITKSAKSLVEFAKMYDGLKSGRFPIQQKIVENFVNWRLNPPEGVGKLRPIDAEAYIASLATQLNLKDGAVADLKDAIVANNPGFDSGVMWNHFEPDDVFNAFMHELLTKMFLAAISGK